MKYLILSLLLVSCASTQDKGVASAYAKASEVVDSLSYISDKSFELVKTSCLTFCFSSETSCICKCNAGVNKLRESTYTHHLQSVEQWQYYIDEWALTQKEKDACEF